MDGDASIRLHPLAKKLLKFGVRDLSNEVLGETVSSFPTRMTKTVDILNSQLCYRLKNFNVVLKIKLVIIKTGGENGANKYLMRIFAPAIIESGDLFNFEPIFMMNGCRKLNIMLANMATLWVKSKNQTVTW